MSAREPKRLSEAPDPLESVGAALYQSLGVDGIYARTALGQEVLERLAALVSRLRHPRAEVLRFPPVMSRRELEKSGYLKSFPNLLGCVCALHGTEGEIRAAADQYEAGGDWTQSLAASDLVLSPAACYPVYPIAARRGPSPPEGRLFDVRSWCFRREPSIDPTRMQLFQMQEYVRI
ncbi:MAG: amino acid--[acyl-carrier-protein] ligase, partial [Steroidobacteraceae bacterium]